MKSLSISLDSSVFTTEDLPPPNSLVELVLGPEESTLSRSNPASAGSEDLLPVLRLKGLDPSTGRNARVDD